MEKTCVRCGYVNTIENSGSQAECPKCRVIYAKAEARSEAIEKVEKSDAHENKREHEEESLSNRKSSIVNYLVIGVLACISLYLYLGRETVENDKKQMVVQQSIGQKEGPDSSETGQMEEPLQDDLASEWTENEEDVNLAYTENEEDIDISSTKNEVVISEFQERNVAVPLEKPPVTNTRKIKADYYLAESTISKGEKVILNDHISDRRFTLFYFYADW